MQNFWDRKTPKLDEAGSELVQILPGEPVERWIVQHRACPSKMRRRFKAFWKGLHRNKEPRKAIQLKETCTGYLQLVQDGQFREACLSISSSAQEGRDCGPLYQTVAQSMWQVVQQALAGVGHSQKLALKLQSVVAAIEWTQDDSQSTEAGALLDDGVAAWGGQLKGLLRTDAEARVPTLGPGGQLGPYLEELDKALCQGLASQRADRLGAHLWDVYKTCFQEVLLSRLCAVLCSQNLDRKGCCTLYAWGKRTLFGQLQEMSPDVPVPSQKPTAGSLVDPLMFVTWMSQTQETLVALIQEDLEKLLENILICDQKFWAQSPSPTFLEIFQMLEETINAAQHIGSPITSQVQAMVLETFSKFLERYQVQAADFVRNAGARTFPELHVLENCCILRKTWQELTQEHVPLSKLDPAVQDTISATEGHSQHCLLTRVRALCQSPLQAHFRKEKDLLQALQSLWQSLDRCPNLHPTAYYKSLVDSLHTVVLGEYVQALAAHLRTLAPRAWEGLRGQVDTDTWKLHTVFREHGGSGLADLQEPIGEIFQLSGNKGRKTVDGWLASFSERFPSFLSTQNKPHMDLDVEVKARRSYWCCC